jgi:hypothetical protein
MTWGRWKNRVADCRNTYQSWVDMRHRCLKITHPNYWNYGGRGITICDSWVNDFDAFVEDMGCAEKGMTIERKDTNGNYEPSNCHWIPKANQLSNTRRNRFFTYQGKTDTISGWARHFGISRHTLKNRLAKQPATIVFQELQK